MIRIVESPRFKRRFRTFFSGQAALQERFREKLKVFVDDPFHPSLASHKLSGRLAESWAFSLNHKIRIVFSFLEEDVVVLENIGSHDEVY